MVFLMLGLDSVVLVIESLDILIISVVDWLGYFGVLIVNWVMGIMLV